MNPDNKKDYQYAHRLYKKLKNIIDELDYGDLCYDLKIAVLEDLALDYKEKNKDKKNLPFNILFNKA